MWFPGKHRIEHYANRPHYLRRVTAGRRSFALKIWRKPLVPRPPLREPGLAEMPNSFPNSFLRLEYIAKHLTRRWHSNLPESQIDRFIKECRATTDMTREEKTRFRHYLMYYLFKSAHQELAACADEIISIIRDWEIQDAVVVPHAIMNAYGHLGRLESVERMAKRIIKNHTYPFVTTLNQLILAHCKRRDMEGAMKVYESFSDWKLGPNQSTFHLLIDGAARMRRMKEFAGLVSEMQTSKLAVNSETFGAIVTGLLESYQPDSLITLLSSMEEAGIKFTTVSFRRAEKRFLRGKQEFVPFVYSCHKDLYRDLPHVNSAVNYARLFEETLLIHAANEDRWRKHWGQFEVRGTLKMRERLKVKKEKLGHKGKFHKKKGTVDRHGRIKGSSRYVGRCQ